MSHGVSDIDAGAVASAGRSCRSQRSRPVAICIDRCKPRCRVRNGAASFVISGAASAHDLRAQGSAASRSTTCVAGSASDAFASSTFDSTTARVQSSHCLKRSAGAGPTCGSVSSVKRASSRMKVGPRKAGRGIQAGGPQQTAVLACRHQLGPGHAGGSYPAPVRTGSQGRGRRIAAQSVRVGSNRFRGEAAQQISDMCARLGSRSPGDGGLAARRRSIDADFVPEWSRPVRERTGRRAWSVVPYVS